MTDHGVQKPWEGHAIDVLFVEHGQSMRRYSLSLQAILLCVALICAGALLGKIFW